MSLHRARRVLFYDRQSVQERAKRPMIDDDVMMILRLFDFDDDGLIHKMIDHSEQNSSVAGGRPARASEGSSIRSPMKYLIRPQSDIRY
jgi:hypothetical protein